MLESRHIITTRTLLGETLRASTAKGCPQGGMLLPVLWSLVMNDLWGLNNGGYYTVGYADDIESSMGHFFRLYQRFYKYLCAQFNSSVTEICHQP
jgi:hypothetical protein